MNPDFLDRIENPRDLNLERLYQKTVDNVEDQSREYGATGLDEWALRKLAYTYYHDWETDKPDLAFLLQDPGNLNERHTREIRRIERLKDAFSPRDLVSIYRNFATSWLVNTRNSDFTRRFLYTCDPNGLIDIVEYWKDYMRTERFFDDFYMTDVIKYRAKGKNVGDPRCKPRLPKPSSTS